MNKKLITATTSLGLGLGFCLNASAQLESVDTPAPEATDTAAPAPAAEQAPVDVITLPDAAPAAVAAEPEQRQRNGIEEVIVTAQRREQSAQDVPVSVTVFTPEQLSNANITGASDLASYTPSLAANSRFGNDNASFAIRGFTQDLRTTASVGTYFAEVIAPRGQSVQTSGDGAGPGVFFDLQNVQVLKGPQGTLFGRNTTGGAVLIVPQRPTDRFEGYGEVTYGNYNNFRQQAVVNVPVVDSFKLRFGIDHNVRDGYLKNYTGIGAKDFNDVNYTTYRVSAVWDITDAVENYTILQYVDSDSNGNTATLFACNNENSAPLNIFTGYVQACERQLADQRARGKDGFYDMASTVTNPVTAIKEKRAINTTTWNVNDEVTFKNIFAYSHLLTENTSAVFGNNFPTTGGREGIPGASYTSPDFPVTNQATWVEEVQLLGTSLDGDLEWQGGVYFENSRPDGPSGNIGASLLNCEQATVQTDSPNCADPTGIIPIPGQILPLGAVQTYAFETEYLNKAIFAQSTYHFTEQFSATLGLRYTWDKTTGKGTRTQRRFSPLATALTTTVTPVSAETKSEAPTGTFELSYKPNQLVMGYAKYVRGYRQGNINMAAAVPREGVEPINTWDPETVDTYEIGAKTQFGGPIPGRFNVAAFYNELTDQQLQFGYVSGQDGTTTTIFNAGKSIIQGVEVEAFFELITDLTAGISYSFLDTELVKQEDRTALVRQNGALTGVPIAVEGDSLPFAPDHTVVSTLTYRLPFSANVGNVDLGATYVYTGKRRTAGSTETPYDMLPSFQLLNLNLNWSEVFGSSFDISLFGTNVLDEKYATYVSGTWGALGFESRQVGQPRMFGGRLRYNF